MAINVIDGVSLDNYTQMFKDSSIVKSKETDTFDSVLSSVMNGLEETNSLQNKAESAEIQFALGESDNTHDLLIAETKASVALQYTVAVRDKLIDAYRELMQMQI